MNLQLLLSTIKHLLYEVPKKLITKIYRDTTHKDVRWDIFRVVLFTILFILTIIVSYYWWTGLFAIVFEMFYVVFIPTLARVEYNEYFKREVNVVGTSQQWIMTYLICLIIVPVYFIGNILRD